MLDHVVFLGNSDTKKSWTEVFGLISLVAGIVMILAVLHVLAVPSWHWFLGHGVLDRHAWLGVV